MPHYEGIGLINEKQPVVIEIGRALTKAGFAGENLPRFIIPSVRQKKSDDIWNQQCLYDIKDEKEIYQALVEFLNIIYFRHLLVTPKDRKVVIVESLFATTKWRNILAKVLYLHYEILNVLWLPSHLAGAVATGCDTALVVDIGVEEAHVFPLVNGVTILLSTLSHELGSTVFDKNLKGLLIEHAIDPKPNMISRLTQEIVEDIRVRTCFVAPLARAEKFASIETLQPKLPPFQIELGSDEFQSFNGVVRELAAEIWFQNSDLEGISIPLMILDVLMKCPLDTRRILAKSILISGGTCILPGFKGRLLRELKKLRKVHPYDAHFNDTYEFKIFDVPAEQNVVNWFGGSVYGSSEAMNIRAIPKEYFLKHGELPDWCNPSSPSRGVTLGLQTTILPKFSSGPKSIA